MANSGFLTIKVIATFAIIFGALFQDGWCSVCVQWTVLLLHHFMPMSFYSLFQFIHSASAIRCWSCASDEYSGQFCNDPFDLSIANEHQQKWAYTECKHPPGQSNPYDQPLAERAVCKKVKQISKLNKKPICLTFLNDFQCFFLFFSQSMWMNTMCSGCVHGRIYMHRKMSVWILRHHRISRRSFVRHATRMVGYFY